MDKRDKFDLQQLHANTENNFRLVVFYISLSQPMKSAREKFLWTQDHQSQYFTSAENAAYT